MRLKIHAGRICEKNPRADINGLVYLKDVDTAKELLIGKTVYIQSESAQVDDANNYSGYQGSSQFRSIPKQPLPL